MPGGFSLFKDPGLLALTPTLVLDQPHHNGMKLARHPYAFIGGGLVATVSAVGVCFIYVGPYLRHLLRLRGFN